MTAASSDAQLSKEGRWIRRLIVALPVGTIILGALSFVIYFENKERKEERTYRHALGLRRDLSEAEISRHLGIIQETAKLPPAERSGTLASYLESSLSPENMGYDVSRQDEQERALITAPLRGTRRPGDVVAVLCGYAGTEENDRALAVQLALARAMTGMPEVRTIEFIALDAASAPAMQQDFASIESRIRAGRGRVTHLIALGPAASALAAARQADNAMGAVTSFSFAAATPDALLPDAEKIKAAIQAAAGKL